MKLGKTLYVSNRSAWRSWLAKNHTTAPEIWLIYYKKGSGKPRIPYDDAVEEALCYGWIDSIVKAMDEKRYAQRFSPRKKTSNLSEMNRERVTRLIARKKMTRAGLKAIEHLYDAKSATRPVPVAPDIRKALRAAKAWKHFETFPEAYKRIRIGWIESARSRPQIFATRLHHFVSMTAKNKRFGMIRE